MNDFIPPNPYEGFAPRFKELDALRKDVESKTIILKEEFTQVFNPDNVRFVELVTASKKAFIDKQPQSIIDAYYKQMAEIYLKWEPIHEYITAANPAYIPLFKALKTLLQEEKHEKKNIANPRTKRTSQKRLSSQSVTRRTE